MSADETVTGSFRNLSEQIVKIDLPGFSRSISARASNSRAANGLMR
jgi:hypothetical protein